MLNPSKLNIGELLLYAIYKFLTMPFMVDESEKEHAVHSFTFRRSMNNFGTCCIDVVCKRNISKVIEGGSSEFTQIRLRCHLCFVLRMRLRPF
jgi:hypothetical protein